MAIKKLVHATAAAASAGAAVTTGAIDTTGATLLVAICATNNANGTPSVSDSASNTWTALTAHSVSGAFAQSQILYVINPTTSATHTVTIGAAASNLAVLSVIAFAGTSTFDAQSGNSTSGAATGITSGTITTTADGELIVWGVANQVTSSTGNFAFAQANAVPVTFQDITAVAGGTHWAQAVGYGYKGEAAAFSIQVNWSGTSASANPSSAIASFKAAASGGMGGGAWAFA